MCVACPSLHALVRAESRPSINNGARSAEIMRPNCGLAERRKLTGGCAAENEWENGSCAARVFNYSVERMIFGCCWCCVRAKRPPAVGGRIQDSFSLYIYIKYLILTPRRGAFIHSRSLFMSAAYTFGLWSALACARDGK